MQRRNIAVILAGGVGSRLGLPTPKQFLPIAGRTVIEHTVDAVEGNRPIDEIALVAHPDYLERCRVLIARNRWGKLTQLLAGGNQRYDSSLAAIRAFTEGDVNLIFHDGVRPLVSQRILDDVALALESHEAVNVAIPSTDTILVTDGDYIRSIPDRSLLRRCQTPQAFRRNVIARAYDLALCDPAFRATDDCGVVVRYLPEVPVYIVPGDERNIKLTYREDIELLEYYLSHDTQYPFP
jgi:2-C-methyl-D-erythritol 4-phosphate cytidylyltransferase